MDNLIFIILLIPLAPFVIGFVSNGGNFNIPRSPKVGRRTGASTRLEAGSGRNLTTASQEGLMLMSGTQKAIALSLMFVGSFYALTLFMEAQTNRLIEHRRCEQEATNKLEVEACKR